jgi:hypothetical protein
MKTFLTIFLTTLLVNNFAFCQTRADKQEYDLITDALVRYVLLDSLVKVENDLYVVDFVNDSLRKSSIALLPGSMPDSLDRLDIEYLGEAAIQKLASEKRRALTYLVITRMPLNGNQEEVIVRTKMTKGYIAGKTVKYLNYAGYIYSKGLSGYEYYSDGEKGWLAVP